MSEELLQVAPKPLGKYLFYKLGNTTLKQLKKAGVVRHTFTSTIAAKKPDCLIMFGGIVKAVIEYKTPAELNTSAKVEKAIKQELKVARQLCKCLIVTSGRKTLWINALNGQRILSKEGQELRRVFDAKPIEKGELSTEDVTDLEFLIDGINHSLTADNNRISSPKVLDPSLLAKTIWQKIWVNTGKEPEKCLYNVVELLVFKFLSDVGVLQPHNNFTSAFRLVHSATPTESLKHYANTCRREIQELFPKGPDGTTIINGTIFVNEHGEPNVPQARLFGEILKDLHDYDKRFGSFKYIKREFKTRLYESFLRQSAGIRFLGQYFTPRNVVQAMVKMSNAQHLRKGARICDPFCGVGGFLLELIAEHEQILAEFIPKNGCVSPSITLIGYDKGSDAQEDERTIILAKANMLIYLSDLLAEYHTRAHLKAFSGGALNTVFTLLRSNLGTFSRVDDEPYDLILTNPPYVTSGSSTLRKAIDTQGLSAHYALSGHGTEAFAVEWIVNNLKKDGEALIIVPDGLLQQHSALSFLKSQCVIYAVISLPPCTFYSTRKKTYILVLKKKSAPSRTQTMPVFTYLVSEIGETRDAKRFTVPQNDLVQLVSLFNQFKNSNGSFKSSTLRCKIVPFIEFNQKRQWLVDRYWKKEEKVALGIEDDAQEITEREHANRISVLVRELRGFTARTPPAASKKQSQVRTIALDDAKFFEFVNTKTLWKREVYREYDTRDPSDIPVYTAAAAAVAFVTIKDDKLITCTKKDRLFSFASNGDGSAGRNFIIHARPFYVSNDRTVLRVRSHGILPEFLWYKLESMKEDFGFDHAYKATRHNLGDVLIDIPITRSGELDRSKQRDVVRKFERIMRLRRQLTDQLKALTTARVILD